MPERTLDVLTVADEGFAVPLAVLGRSIADHLAPDSSVRLTVIDGGLTLESIERCRRSWPDSITAAFVRPDNLPSVGLSVSGRVPPSTFDRLAAGSVLPAERTRVLILDADQLVRADVTQFLDTSFDGSVALAPVDAFIPTLGSPFGLKDPETWGLRPDQPFLCGAVVLLDLVAWREGRFEDRARKVVAEHYASFSTWDQDVLNIVLAGRWRPLDPSWQHQPRLKALGLEPATAVMPAIVHFSGRLKPWLYRGHSQWDRAFLETLARTAFKDRMPRRDVRGLLWELYDSPLRRLFYPVERRVERLFRHVARRK